MGKKFTTLVSTLALAASGLTATISPPPAYATGETEISLDDYWSFSEILELKTAIETAAKENCGEDYECRVEYRRQEILSHYREDRRYMLVGQIIDTNFTVTGINPTKETVTIYYNDENMEEWEFTREETRSHLKDVYLAWAEEGYPDMRNSRVSFNDGSKNRSGPIYVADANNGTTTDKVHLVFAHKPSDGNPADTWLEYGKENVLDVTGSNLINDTKHMLHFSVYAYEGFSAVGAVVYSEFAVNYQPGMEYKLMYDKNNLYEYWIPQYVGGEESTTPEEVTTPEEPTIPEDPESENPIENPTEEIATSKEPSKPTFTLTVREISTSNIGVPTTPVTVAKTSSNPTTDTPISTSPAEENYQNCGSTEKTNNESVELPLSGEEEHVFPWWIIVFIFSGIALTIWWFIPVKKYEKSIDK